MITAQLKEPEKISAQVDQVVVQSGGGIGVEKDPTVPAWAKQPNKPTYTAEDVGALPADTKIPSTADDVGALPKGTKPADIGAQPAGNYALKSDIPTIPTIPTKLPNPNPLTFTGAASGTYDGSAPLTVNIPAGGGGDEVAVGDTEPTDENIKLWVDTSDETGGKKTETWTFTLADGSIVTRTVVLA